MAESRLNDHQRHHLLASCQYVTRQLAEVEAILTSAAGAGSPFARYVDDLTPEQRAVVRESCAGIRAAMSRVLEGQGIAPGEAPVSSRHAIRGALNFMDIALEELQPRYMKSYGQVPPAVEPELNRLVEELQALVRRLDAALSDAAAPEDEPRGSAAGEVAMPGPAPALSAEAASLFEGELRKVEAAIDGARVAVDALEAPQAPIIFDALEHAADRASRAMNGPDAAPNLDATVREGVMAVGTDRAEDVRRALANAIARARSTLQAAARQLGLPESTADQEWTRLVREMPPFVVGDLHVNLRLFMRRALGAGVAHARVRKAIEAQVGADVAAALTAHSRALHGWALRVWTRVREDFDREAARCRLRPPAAGAPAARPR